MKISSKHYHMMVKRGTTACVLAMAFCGTAAFADDDILNYEPHKIIEDEKAVCAQCHENAVTAWEQSTHKKTYDELHKRESAQAIAKAMGISSITRGDECIQCHYTQYAKTEGGKAKAVMGVSCQRCHGAAADWLDPHQDTEGNPDRADRLAKSSKLGMRLTSDIYTLAMNCFQCHTVPREELVNKGMHPAGSDFELVAWSHGEVRHNFLVDDTPTRRKEGDKNQDSSKEEKQIFYVVGKSLDLEFALRGLANATEDGTYLTAMGERAQKAYDALKELGGMDSILSQVPMDGGSVKVAASNAAEYNSAADGIRKVAKTIESDQGKFSAALSAAGSKLPSSFHGEVYE